MYKINYTKIESFFNDYKKNTYQNEVGLKHINLADEVINFSKNCEILYYTPSIFQNESLTFVIIPSIFNSVEILFLNSNVHFIDNLKTKGEVYLLNWLEIDNANFNLENYIIESLEIIKFINAKTSKQICLIGHCIGGNIALIAGTLCQDIISNLLLLTTPLDFSHFKTISHLHKEFDLDAELRNLTCIPNIYIKILFFLLFSDYFNIKMEKYSNFEFECDKKLFLSIEHWLMSGVSLPRAVYFQIINNLVLENSFLDKTWQLGGKKVNIKNFKRPLFIVVAKNDRLVPKTSVLSFCEIHKNIKLIEVKGGHISYLIGPQLEYLFAQYRNWIKED